MHPQSGNKYISESGIAKSVLTAKISVVMQQMRINIFSYKQTANNIFKRNLILSGSFLKWINTHKIAGMIELKIKNHFEVKTAIFSPKLKNRGIWSGHLKITTKNTKIKFTIANIKVFKSNFLFIIKE